MSNRVRTIILGAAGRDFHNFNMVYRDDPATEVVAFTGAQIPGISGRRYPASLAGPLYPHGIPIEDEAHFEDLCRKLGANRVVFAYSDVTHEAVMHAASRSLAAGADFVLLGPGSTCLEANVPVVAVTAARTGSGKSPLSRWIAGRIASHGRKVAVVRHPMPYGDLGRQRAQRFASKADISAAECTAEEREEYEAHVAAGSVVFAGVDYAAVLAAAEAEADVIVWDGGNNDFPFFRPDIQVAVLDALRADQAEAYHPGEAVLRMADVIVVSKTNAATHEQVEAAEHAARHLNPSATVVRGALPIHLDDPGAVRGRRVLVVDDGPTITHGGMPYGAGFVAAREAGAREILDPRAHAARAIREVYSAYPHIGAVLPAVGYSEHQIEALRATINASGAEVVVSGTPIDLAALIKVSMPIIRARYEFSEVGHPVLETMVMKAVAAATANHPR
ncbi:MAG: tetraacyldisaccharide 4'-kinase [Dehalococcoidia bacterium]|nr:tetraacyldisaccharide 4'-kinase [Dehalococcoidia bacterium]